MSHISHYVMLCRRQFTLGYMYLVLGQWELYFVRLAHIFKYLEINYGHVFVFVRF